MPTIASRTIGAGEAARRLKMSTEHLRRLAVDGRVPYSATPYGRVYDEADIERLRQEREQRSA